MVPLIPLCVLLRIIGPAGGKPIPLTGASLADILPRTHDTA